MYINHEFAYTFRKNTGIFKKRGERNKQGCGGGGMDWEFGVTRSKLAWKIPWMEEPGGL